MPPEDEKQTGDVGSDQDPKGGADGGTQDGAGGEPDWKAEAEKWKAHSRKHEGQAKANADAARRLKEIEDANKTETQKLADEKAAAESAAKSVSGELMRLRVAMRKGLTEAQAKRLVGDTEEELEQDADDLLASFGQKNDSGADTDPGKPTRPRERLRSGSAPDADPEETDPRKLAASVPRL